MNLNIYNKIVGKSDKGAPFWKKLIAGSASGLVGSALGNPADVLKTRMMASEGSNLVNSLPNVIWIN